MKLCLFNVENFFLLGGPNGDGFKKPSDKIEWIARTIREINADVTMLCEVGGLESLDLFNTKYLNSEYISALLKGNSNRGIEMGYLVKKDFTGSKFALFVKSLFISASFPPIPMCQ